MDDLSHWDFAVHFSGHDAAALILGIEPRKAPPSEHRIWVVKERLESDYARALQQAEDEMMPFLDEQSLKEVTAKRSEDMLVSVSLDKLWRNASAGIKGADTALLFDEDLPQFQSQMFTRSAIIRWLNAVGMPSKYMFDRVMDESGRWTRRSGLEPEDLPIELDIALIAFQAVRNGFGDHSATYKNRLEAYLRQFYSDLKDSVIDRIATVANPDKERGRKKSVT